MDLAGLSDDEIRRMKREHAIKQRELEYEKKREEDEARKKDDLFRALREEEEKKAEEEKKTMAFLAARAKQRVEKKKKEDALDAKRCANIEKDRQIWLEKMNKKIQRDLDEYAQYEDGVETRLQDARNRKQRKQDQKRKEELERITYNEDLNSKREEKEIERATARLVKELVRVDAVKAEGEEELRSFINHPAPVPLKQVLAGRLRPVPTVTQLLAAHKDHREDLKELEDADLSMRALLRQQTLFEYVKNIQAKAEEERIKPPEPVIGDMGRGTRSKSPRRQGSPMRTTGGFRKGNKSPAAKGGMRGTR